MAADLKDKVGFCVRIGAGVEGGGELVVEQRVAGWEGLGFRGPRQGARGLKRPKRQTKGCRSFSKQVTWQRRWMGGPEAVCTPVHPPHSRTQTPHSPPSSPCTLCIQNLSSIRRLSREVETGYVSSCFLPSQVTSASQDGGSALTEPKSGLSRAWMMGRWDRV